MNENLAVTIVIVIGLICLTTFGIYSSSQDTPQKMCVEKMTNKEGIEACSKLKE